MKGPNQFTNPKAPDNYYWCIYVISSKNRVVIYD